MNRSRWAVVATSMLLLGCGKSELSRSTAKSMLSTTPISAATKKLPYNEEGRFVGGSGDQLNWEHNTELVLNKLQAAGFITYKKDVLSYREEDRNIGIVYAVSFTAKLKPFIVEDVPNRHVTVRTSEEVVAEITGISKHPMDESSRLVEYTTKTTNNELSQLLEPDSNHGTNDHHTAHFKRYDDGWRVVERR